MSKNQYIKIINNSKNTLECRINKSGNLKKFI